MPDAPCADPTVTDRELLAAVGRGDRDALEQIYHRHKDRLLNVAYHMLGDLATAEDVLQDVLVQLARRARDLRLELDLRGYLLQSALNRARDLLRRPRMAPAVDQGTDDPGSSPIECAGRSERAAAVAVALGALPVEQREVVILHVFEGMKFREIAALLALSINTAQSRYRYALAALRDRLTRQGVEG